MVIGTPPDTHLKIFNQIKNYNIKNILIEKPLCSFKQNENYFEISKKFKSILRLQSFVSKALITLKKFKKKKI